MSLSALTFIGSPKVLENVCRSIDRYVQYIWVKIWFYLILEGNAFDCTIDPAVIVQIELPRDKKQTKKKKQNLELRMASWPSGILES